MPAGLFRRRPVAPVPLLDVTLALAIVAFGVLVVVVVPATFSF
jgi:hypothetical protein